MPKKINTPSFLLAFGLRPDRASKYLKDKGLQTTWNTAEMSREAHDKAFTVAKIMQADILQDIADAIQKAIDNGQTFQDFRKDMKNTLAAKGWWDQKTVTDPKTGDVSTVDLSNVRRLDNIFRTNLQNAMMAGRLEGQMLTANQRPFYQIRAIEDDRTTNTCLQINGKVFRFDDADAPYPPFHFRCRTRAVSLSLAQLQKLGLQATESRNIPEGTYGLNPKWLGRPNQTVRPDGMKYSNDINDKLGKSLVRERRKVRETDVNDLVLAARAAGDDVEALGDKINKAFGGLRTPVNYKTAESMTRKADSELDGALHRWVTKLPRKPGTVPTYIDPRLDVKLKDSVRNTVILDPDKIDDALDSLAGDKSIVAIKRQRAEDFAGYSGTIISHRAKNGLIVETQVNTAPMIYAKELPEVAKAVLGEDLYEKIKKKAGTEGGKGHGIYERIRVLKKGSKEQEDAIRESERYYAKFRTMKIALKP